MSAGSPESEDEKAKLLVISFATIVSLLNVSTHKRSTSKVTLSDIQKSALEH